MARANKATEHKATESAVIYDLNRPDVPKGTHPVETDFYQMPTNEIVTVLSSVCEWIEDRVTGAIIFGRPRLGKTYMIEFMIENIPKVLGVNVPVYHIVNLHPKIAKEEEFLETILGDVQHQFVYNGKASRKRERLINFLLERGTSNHFNVVVFIVDEAQCLEEKHYEWLMDYFNKLRKEKVTLLTYLVGQQQLSSQKTIFSSAHADQIVQRFMIEEHKFSGIKTKDDIETLLKCYDDPEICEYPSNSGWSFTRYYFPEAYATGMRLAAFSSNLHKLLKDTHRKEKIRSEFEIPMHYMVRMIKTIFLRYGKDSIDYKGGWITEAHWVEAINKSKYVQSEQKRVLKV